MANDWDAVDPKSFKQLDPEALRQPIIEPPRVPVGRIPQEDTDGKDN